MNCFRFDISDDITFVFIHANTLPNTVVHLFSPAHTTTTIKLKSYLHMTYT